MEDFFQLNSLLSTIYKFQSSHSLVHPIAGRSPIKVLSGILWLHHKKKTQSGFTGASAWSDSQQALKEACVYEVDENVPWVSIWLNGLFCNKILRPNRKSLYFVILSPFFLYLLKTSNHHYLRLLGVKSVDGSTYYNVYAKILDASKYGLPQSRHRLFIVALKKRDMKGKFWWPMTGKHVSLDKVIYHNVCGGGRNLPRWVIRLFVLSFNLHNLLLCFLLN